MRVRSRRSPSLEEAWPRLGTVGGHENRDQYRGSDVSGLSRNVRNRGYFFWSLRPQGCACRLAHDDRDPEVVAAEADRELERVRREHDLEG